MPNYSQKILLAELLNYRDSSMWETLISIYLRKRKLSREGFYSTYSYKIVNSILSVNNEMRLDKVR
jgi:hypothetical protein